MSKKIYTLNIHENQVFMPMREFIELAGELQHFGVDVDLQPDASASRITFTLCETNRTQ